jgi:hypothetical protein
VQPVLSKSWRRITVLSLLGASVIAVIGMAIHDSRQNAHAPEMPPAVRAITDDPLPDLSEAGFRLGGLAVSLVGSLFSGTQAVMAVGDPVAASTSVVVSTTAVRESSEAVSTAVATTSTSTTSTSTTSTSTTSTSTTSTSTTSTSTTVPISRQPENESVEPNVESTIFGQTYLDSWPTLDMWDRIAWCESRRTWDVDTGNGYFGGLQFALGSWQWVGGAGNPADASKEEQIYRANLLWQAQGWNGWPGCKKYFGWTKWQVNQ